MKRLAPLASGFALLLVAAGVPLAAQSADLGVFSGPSSVSYGDPGVSQPFLDSFQFTIAAGSELVFSSLATSGPSNRDFIQDLEGALYSGPLKLEAGVATNDTSMFFLRSVQFSPLILGPGTYQLDFTGTPTSAFPDMLAQGFYSGTLTLAAVSAVPEPASVAFVLCGLAMLGYGAGASRRRVLPPPRMI